MPLYDYRCGSGHISSFRRMFAERDEPAFCEQCGRTAQVAFTPSANIHIPISFRTVLSNGEAGGGQLSWSDFHDYTEKELARMPNVEKASVAWSQPGVGGTKHGRRSSKPAGEAVDRAAGAPGGREGV